MPSLLPRLRRPTSFDWLAPHYRWLEIILAGRTLQQARLAHLSALDHARHVLLVGEGPGRFLTALRVRRPHLPITVVDQSAAMLRVARGRVRDSCTHFVQADLRTWQVPRNAYDGIVTSCVLDCFEANMVQDIVARLAGGARPQATWLHIDFAIPPRGWPRARARAIHALMYATFQLATGIEAGSVTPPDRWLRGAGFFRQSTRAFSAGLIRSDRWERPAVERRKALGSARPAPATRL